MKELLPPSSPSPSRPSSGGLSRSSVHRVAREGLAGSGGALPYLDRLQAAFGAHDLQNVVAHTDAAAAKAAGGLGAAAYARGNHVAFAGPPSLFVAAHEAAHIVQQRSGLVSEGAVGAPGDRLERQADGVAAAVVAGASVEGMLGAPGPAASAEAVQCYFLGNEVFNRSPSIPAGARISENGKLVLLGKQQLVATEGAIDTANAALEENSMV
ncbi:MAG TPA: DUF4157 domain-containing protein, partial [Myxococcota bacterium]|nr:DUF4157 domain-containing protein [Myxococcota bacterium]